MKKYSIEFFGTFFLLLISALTENPIAIGLGLASLIYVGAHISGAHYNPAVSIAMVIRGEINKTECFKYCSAQILGAIAGSFIYFLITNNIFEIQPDSNTTRIQFLIAEFIFTFLNAIVWRRYQSRSRIVYLARVSMMISRQPVYFLVL